MWWQWHPPRLGEGSKFAVLSLNLYFDWTEPVELVLQSPVQFSASWWNLTCGLVAGSADLPNEPDQTRPDHGITTSHVEKMRGEDDRTACKVYKPQTLTCLLTLTFQFVHLSSLSSAIQNAWGSLQQCNCCAWPCASLDILLYVCVGLWSHYNTGDMTHYFLQTYFNYDHGKIPYLEGAGKGLSK